MCLTTRWRCWSLFLCADSLIENRPNCRSYSQKPLHISILLFQAIVSIFRRWRCFSSIQIPRCKILPFTMNSNCWYGYDRSLSRQAMVVCSILYRFCFFYRRPGVNLYARIYAATNRKSNAASLLRLGTGSLCCWYNNIRNHHVNFMVFANTPKQPPPRPSSSFPQNTGTKTFIRNAQKQQSEKNFDWISMMKTRFPYLSSGGSFPGEDKTTVWRRRGVRCSSSSFLQDLDRDGVFHKSIGENVSSLSEIENGKFISRKLDIQVVKIDFRIE